MKKKLFTDNSGWVRSFETKEQAFEYFSSLKEKWGNLGFAEDISEVKELATSFKAEKEIHDDESFSQYCSEFLDCWLEDMSKDARYVRPVREDDCVEDNISFMYTDKGSRMVERAVSRLTKVGYRHGFDDVSIGSSYYEEC